MPQLLVALVLECCARLDAYLRLKENRKEEVRTTIFYRIEPLYLSDLSYERF